MVEIKEVVKLIRQAEGMSQAEFAERVGVTRSYVSLVEGGKKKPSIGFLKRMSGELEVPLIVLLAGEGDEVGNKRHSAEEAKIVERVVALLSEIVADRIKRRVHSKERL